MNETVLIALLADLEAALRKAREALTVTVAPTETTATAATAATAPATTTTAPALVGDPAPAAEPEPAPATVEAPAPKPKRGRPAQVTDLTPAPVPDDAPAPGAGMDRTAFMAAARDILQRHGNDQTPVRKTLDDFSIATPTELDPSQYKTFLAALRKNYGES